MTNAYQNWAASVLIVGHFLLTLAFSLSVPLAEAPDEADHWAYVVYLAQERTLPIGPKVTQSKHPPFYHATAALVALPGGPSRTFLRPNPDVSFRTQPSWSPNFFIHPKQETWPWRDGILAFRLARLWSILLSTATVAATYGLARSIFPTDPWLVLGIVGALAFWPEFAFIGATVNNDNAAALFGTLSLWGAFAIYQAGGRLGAGWWTPLALGLGLFSKVSTVGIWPAVGMSILLGTLIGRQKPFIEPIRASVLYGQQWMDLVLKRSAILFGLALLIASPWLVRNWLLYGDPLGLEMAKQTVDLRLTPWTWSDSEWLLRGWFLSFWGKFGAIGHVAMADWVYQLLAIISGTSLLGLLSRVLYLSRRWVAHSRIAGAQSVEVVSHDAGGRSGQSRTAVTGTVQVHIGILLGLLALALITVIVVMWRYSLLALGTDQGRLLYPAVAPIVILFVYGLYAWVPMGGKRAFPWVLSSGMLLLSLYALLGVVGPAFGPPPILTASYVADQIPVDRVDSAQNQIDSPITFGELNLIAWKLTKEPILYWHSPEKPTTDWRTILRITAEDGTLIWEWKRSPAGGRWSTDRWPADTIVEDGYQVRWPDHIGSGRYRVEIGVEPFSSKMVIPRQADIPLTSDDHPFVQLGWLVR